MSRGRSSGPEKEPPGRKGRGRGALAVWGMPPRDGVGSPVPDRPRERAGRARVRVTSPVVLQKRKYPGIRLFLKKDAGRSEVTTGSVEMGLLKLAQGLRAAQVSDLLRIRRHDSPVYVEGRRDLGPWLRLGRNRRGESPSAASRRCPRLLAGYRRNVARCGNKRPECLVSPDEISLRLPAGPPGGADRRWGEDVQFGERDDGA